MSVGIKDIARALGISTGTVDRALHAKPGVNPATRARVLSMAAELGYCPNLAARYLKSRKQLRISVHLPREIALFWDPLRESIREAAAPFAPALHVDFETCPDLGEGDIPLFEKALREGTNGLISQGRLALQTLYQFLRDGTRPPERIHVVPHLVMQSNLDLFLERLPVDLERA